MPDLNKQLECTATPCSEVTHEQVVGVETHLGYLGQVTVAHGAVNVFDPQVAAWRRVFELNDRLHQLRAQKAEQETVAQPEDLR